MEKKKSKFKFYLIYGVVCVFLSIFLGAALFAFLDDVTQGFSFSLITTGFDLAETDFKGYFLWVGICFAAFVSIPIFFTLNKEYASKTPHALLGQKYDTKSDKKGAAHWLSSAEINRLFPRYSFAEAEKHKVNGFVVQTIETKMATYANIKGDVHCLIIGTTGSGKTIRFVVPTMQFLARTASRPSLIVTDPKGELYEGQSKLFQEKGYEIIKINLRDPLQHSNCWNPCHLAFKWYQEALIQKQKIKFHYDKIGDYEKKIKLITDKKNYHEEWYEYGGYAFVNLKDAVLQAERRENSLKAKAMESVSDLVTTIYAESAKKAQDPFWVKSASQLVEGLLLALLEDSEIEELGITEQRFNLGTIASTLSVRVDHLKSYFAVRDVNSYAKRKAQGSVSAPQSGTQESIVSTALADLSPFSDPDVQFITCNNDIEFENIGLKPTVVFLIVPDEKENRHVFASLFISQAYKALVELAGKHHRGSVPHPVNFIVDEFANLPMIPGMDNKITVARGRGLSFMLIIQALSQLRAKYGPDVAEIIKTNCNMQVFLATNDNETAEYFSKICGEKTVQEVSSNQDSQSGRQNLSYSLGARPLIKTEELLTLKEGISIVKLLRTQPAKLQQMPFWKSRSFYQGKEVIEDVWNPKMFVFEEDGYYDIVDRNRIDAEFLQEPLENFDLDLLKIDKEADENNDGGSGDDSGGGGAIGTAIDNEKSLGFDVDSKNFDPDIEQKTEKTSFRDEDNSIFDDQIENYNSDFEVNNKQKNNTTNNHSNDSFDDLTPISTNLGEVNDGYDDFDLDLDKDEFENIVENQPADKPIEKEEVKKETKTDNYDDFEFDRENEKNKLSDNNKK